jgi:hypothetical protein
MSNNNGGIPVAGQKPQNDLAGFIPVVTFSSVGCYACKQQVKAIAPIVCQSLGELVARAKAEHKNASPLCFDAQIMIDYDTSLIDAKLLNNLTDETILVGE